MGSSENCSRANQSSPRCLSSNCRTNHREKHPACFHSAQHHSSRCCSPQCPSRGGRSPRPLTVQICVFCKDRLKPLEIKKKRKTTQHQPSQSLRKTKIFT